MGVEEVEKSEELELGCKVFCWDGSFLHMKAREENGSFF